MMKESLLLDVKQKPSIALECFPFSLFFFGTNTAVYGLTETELAPVG